LESHWNQRFGECNEREKSRNLKDSTHPLPKIAARAKSKSITSGFWFAALSRPAKAAS
jgi:hypothetical protein